MMYTTILTDRLISQVRAPKNKLWRQVVPVSYIPVTKSPTRQGQRTAENSKVLPANRECHPLNAIFSWPTNLFLHKEHLSPLHQYPTNL